METPWWDDLRAGRTDKGLRLLRREYKKTPHTAFAMELGVALLWIGDHQAAWEVFHGVTLAHPLDASVIYGMAGVAKWCLNDPAEAIRFWQDGLRCAYADAAGGLRLPLLLYFASIVRPRMVDKVGVERLLTSRAKKPMAALYWPGDLARFVLGQIDDAHLRERIMRDDLVSAPRALFETDFYTAVGNFAGGNRRGFKQSMRRMAKLEWSDFDEDRDKFSGRIRSEEFHLARHIGNTSLRARG